MLLRRRWPSQHLDVVCPRARPAGDPGTTVAGDAQPQRRVGRRSYGPDETRVPGYLDRVDELEAAWDAVYAALLGRGTAAVPRRPPHVGAIRLPPRRAGDRRQASGRVDRGGNLRGRVRPRTRPLPHRADRGPLATVGRPSRDRRVSWRRPVRTVVRVDRGQCRRPGLMGRRHNRIRNDTGANPVRPSQRARRERVATTGSVAVCPGQARRY